MRAHRPLTLAERQTARDAAQHALHKAVAERGREDPRAPGNPWRAVAQALARAVLALTTPESR